MAIMKLLFIIAALGFQFSLVAQETKEDYLQKSKHQKTAGFITLGVGMATLVPGFYYFSRISGQDFPDNFITFLKGAAFTAGGVVLIITSISLFTRARKNEEKANTFSLLLNKPIIINTGVTMKTLPYSVGVALRI